jgi:nucleoside-diphosphate-sugar epimerase
MKLLVTGASGFLGSHVVEAALRRGHYPLALVRKSSNVELLRRLNVELSYADLHNPAEIHHAVSMVDAIIHCAAITNGINEEELVSTNEQGTKNLLHAAATRCPSLRRFVYVSSIAAHGPSDGARPRPEESPASPVSAYGRSKRAGELAVLSYQDQIPVTIVRPPALYGPRNDALLPLFKLAKLGYYPSFGEGYISLLSVEDCAEALLSVIENPLPTGSIFAVDDGESYPINAMAELACKATGRKLRGFLTLPRMLRKALALGGDLAKRATGRDVFFGSDKMAEIDARYWVAGNRALCQATGWSPRDKAEAGISRLYQKYQREGRA